MQKKETKNIEIVFNNQMVLRTLTDAYKQKDYNKLSYKLRNYQHMILSLQAPPLTDIHKLQQIDNSLILSNQLVKEINFSTDELVQDLLSIGYRNHSQILDHLTEVIKLMHDYLVNKVKEDIQNINLENNKNEKKIVSLCPLCHEIQEASNLRKLKTSFGLEYNQNTQIQSTENRQKQSAIAKQAEDFIEQLNIMLSKKDKLLNLQFNSSKLSALVNSLSKLTEFGEQMWKRNERIKKTKIEEMSAKLEEQNKQFQDQHQNIVEQLRGILQEKIKNGYSYRFKDLLDKFEKAIKDDKTGRVEKKTFINITDAQVQTFLTPEAVELKIAKEQLAQKAKEIEGIKEGRKNMEQRFMKTLQNERKIIKELSSNAAKGQHMNNAIDVKTKEIMHLQQNLQRMKSDFQLSHFDQPSKFGTFQSIHGKVNDMKPEHFERVSHEKSMKSCRSKAHSRKNQMGVQTEELQRQEEEKKEMSRSNVELIFREDPQRKKIFKKYEKPNYKPPNVQKTSEKAMFVNTESISERKLRNLDIQSLTLEIIIAPHNKHQSTQACQENKTIETIEGKTSVIKNSQKEGSTRVKVRKNTSIRHKTKKVSIKKYAHEKRMSTEYEQQFQDHIAESYESNNISYLASRCESTPFQNQISLANISETTQKSDTKISKLSKTTFLRQIKDVRNTETGARNKYLINTPTAEGVQKNAQMQNYTVIRNKENKIRINKFERKTSQKEDKEKVKQIIKLLKNQSKFSSFKPRKSQLFQKNDTSEAPSSYEISSPEKEYSEHILQIREKEAEVEPQQNIIQAIQQAKTIIQTQYSYLKATGFIDYLYELNKKVTASTKKSTRYHFEFTHITEKDLKLFGGLEEVVRYSRKIGRWKQLLEEQEELRLNYRNGNFVAKICRYLKLLQRMNEPFYNQYMNFLAHPLDYCQRHLGQQVCSKTKEIMESADFVSLIEEQPEAKESEVILSHLLMRLINYHNRCHEKCSHIAQFLEKIGYYRYAM